MLLPIRTSIRSSRTPYTNYVLIVVNVIIFLLEYHIDPSTGGLVFKPWVSDFMLTPARPFLWQFVSYAFLHEGLLHIFGNMFFLYLFGNNVNDKLGHIGYLCFYLAGAVFSAIGHTLLHYPSAIPTLGASGAVAAITGAYLVLFPQTLITVIYWLFYFIGTMKVPALYFIAFKMIFIDNIIVRYTPHVAYNAHLSGYAFGILAMFGMLAAGLITGSSFDLWAIIKRWNQRRRYRDVVSSGYDSFTGRTARHVKVKEVKKTTVQKQKEEKIKQLRSETNRRITQRNLPAAAELYMELIGLDDKQLPPLQHLLDIANQLASENKHAEAARAYEKFLAHYGRYEYIEQVELMLGILYSRYLNHSASAVKHLKTAVEKLSDTGQLKMCKDELTKLQN